MNKRISLFTVAGLLLFLLLCLVPSSQAQECTQVALGATPAWQVGMTCKFTSTSTPVPFTAAGTLYWVIDFVPQGTVTGAALSIDASTTGLPGSWSTGGILTAATIGSMTSSGSYGPNATATTPANWGQLTPTITGSGSVTVPEGSFDCMVYTGDFDGAGSTYWAAAGVPVPIKVYTACDGTTYELVDWG